MHENINVILENTVQLETIEEKTEVLSQGAFIFKRSATELKNKIWWKNLKFKLIIITIIFIILIIIISVTTISLRNN